MCAIAALASCSQNDEVTTDVSNAEEAKVYLQLKGDGVNTRADGDPEPGIDTEVRVKDVTVFFFNTAGSIIGSPKYIVGATEIEKAITTTTDAAQVAVIANLGTDEITGKFQGVKSLEQLKKVSFSSITAGAVNQSVNNVYMSGMGTIVPDGDGFKADVTLHFISAKITDVKINWVAGQSYGVHSTFKASTDKHFAIKQVYLMKAQTNSYLLPTNASGHPVVDYTGSFVPTQVGWAGGLPWTNAPGDKWTPIPNPVPIATDDYIVKTDLPATAAGGNGITNVLANKSWYTFENDLTSDPTGLIVEYVWRSVASSTQDDELLTRYFTVYFGEKKGTDTQPLLEAGKSYKITLNLNGDFTPGGSGGGGTPDPTKPSTDAQVTVNILPAAWTTAEMSKDFD